jgi:hypothetical protein
VRKTFRQQFPKINDFAARSHFEEKDDTRLNMFKRTL